MTAVPLKSLCQIRHGGTPSKANAAFWRGAIPWVSPKDMKSTTLSDASDHITPEAVKSSATRLVPEKSILVVVRSGILAHSLPVAQTARALAFNQDIKALMPDSAKVDPDYLFWFIRSQERRVLSQGVKKGATVHSLQSGFIENLEVPLPGRARQRQIVDLLSQGEGILRLRREAQTRAAEVVPALFFNMFGHPQVYASRWEILALSAVSEVISGVAKGRELSGPDVVELPYMRVANVKDGHLDLTDIKSIRLKQAEVPKLKLEPGDLLMTEGGDPDKLGRAALWRGELPLCVHQNHIFKVRADRSKATPEYLRALVGSNYGKAYFLRVAKRTTGIASINKTQLSAFPVLLPPLPLQQAFAARVEALGSIERLQRAAAKQAQATFDALIARAFSSRVNVAERISLDQINAMASAEASVGG
jgi:type I restriction enzyme S subunit